MPTKRWFLSHFNDSPRIAPNYVDPPGDSVVDVLSIPLFWFTMFLSTIFSIFPEMGIAVLARYGYYISDRDILQVSAHSLKVVDINLQMQVVSV